jgi:hypothetical protein
MCQRNAKVLAEVFIKFYLILCKVVPALALQLQEPNVLVINQKWYQSKGSVIFTDVETMNMRFLVKLQAGEDGFLYIACPETSIPRETRLRRVNVAMDNVPAKIYQVRIIIRTWYNLVALILHIGGNFKGKGLLGMPRSFTTKVFPMFLQP